MKVAETLRAARDEGRTVVVPYLMVDRGRIGRLEATVAALKNGGATALELGFPFSDPIADGPVLETAAGRSLLHGTRWADLLESCRRASRTLPTAVMTYANPVLSHGLDTASEELAKAGASALIVPDLSLEESRPWRQAVRRAGIDLVLLAAPGVSGERLERIARTSRGFLYLVARYGTTGTSKAGTGVDLAPLVATAHAAAPGLPVLVGFGVRDRASAGRALRSGADGVVVGSALEELLERGARAGALSRWLRPISEARPGR